jgi:hypothetical protein
MRIRYGLTTWIVCVGPVAMIWRWNMPLRQAIRTCHWRRHRNGNGYAATGPLIVEW